MAITERYVTRTGTDTYANSTSSSTPMSFATAITNAAAGDRINIKYDATPYSIGATTFPATGTFDAPVVWRGYHTTIGDCDNLGRNTDGTLTVDNGAGVLMPAIEVTGIWSPANYITLQSLNITASLASAILFNTTADYLTIVSCRIENTQSNASASCVVMDDNGVLLNSDLKCSGATSHYVLSADITLRCSGCRFEIAASDNCMELNAGCTITRSVFIKNGTLGGTAINFDTTSNAITHVENCTFYNLTNAILSTLTHTSAFLVLIENHCTDCTQFINNTTNIACYDIRNRTRDNTSPPSTVELITVGAITTDTGGASTDFVDAANGDLHLITTAPGYNAGWDGSDIGGLQTDPPASSGGSALHLGSLGQTGIGSF